MPPAAASATQAAPRKGEPVLEAFIDALTWDETIGHIRRWADRRDSRYVCICNVHSVVTTTQDVEFKLAVNNADLCTPDGAPIAWALRQLGHPGQERINGPDLMWRYLADAELTEQRVFFLGSTDDTLEKLRTQLKTSFPRLQIAGIHAPPFRPLLREEDDAIVDMINRSCAQVVFIGLGCPKQEKWMSEHRGRVQAVMVGVGAAFDYHSGVIKRAPLWWQEHGLEWLYRLGSEPRRLFKRYMVTNSLFVVGFLRQVVGRKMQIRDV